MIGRAASGNPWIIYRTIKCLETGELLHDPSPKEKIDVCTLHMDRLVQIKGERMAIQEMRKHTAWYLRGLKGSGQVRRQINGTPTRDGLLEVLYTYAHILGATRSAS